MNEKILLDALVLSGSWYTALCRVWSSYRVFKLIVRLILPGKRRSTFLILSIPSLTFLLLAFIVPFNTKLLGYYRDTVSRCHPRLLHTVQLPLHLGSDGPDWDPLEHLVLSIPCLAADPAVIEDIRLVNAELIRLGGPKRQNWIFF